MKYRHLGGYKDALSHKGFKVLCYLQSMAAKPLSRKKYNMDREQG